MVTKEGKLDNIDWEAAGFEFCGETPDGEIAFPLLRLERNSIENQEINL